jgi:heterodisulfide reductase subunit D
MTELADLRRSSRAALCIACGKCTTMCPLAELGEFSARKIIHEGHEELVGESLHELGRCLTCASCEQRCPQGVSFTDFVRGARSLVPPQQLPPRPHGQVFDRIAALEGANGSRLRVKELFRGLNVTEEGEVGLFIGCLPHFNTVFKERLDFKPTDIARGAVRILNEMGIRPVVVADENCCGHDQLWTGQRELFENLARHNLEAFEKRGVKKILTACAECARTWKLDYAELDGSYHPEVQHLVELLGERTDELLPHLGKSTPAKVTYQDPCRLGRHLGSYEAPRHFLEELPGVELCEMENSGQNAVCCGTPGFIHCDAASKALQRRRLEEAQDTEAELLLTACPKCLIHFSCSLEEDRRNGNAFGELTVQDITLFAAEKLKRAKASRRGSSPARREGEDR